MLDLFSTFLDAGFAALDQPPPSPEAVSLCITGGLWELVRRYALDRRLHELPDVLPAVSYLCLSTFFGSDEAVRAGALSTRPCLDEPGDRVPPAHARSPEPRNG